MCLFVYIVYRGLYVYMSICLSDSKVYMCFLYYGVYLFVYAVYGVHVYSPYLYCLSYYGLCLYCLWCIYM